MPGPRVVTVHQPEHLPWLGFFAKMARADLLVSLDTVAYRKNYFQNRNRVLGHDGRPMWLTVPVRLEGHLEGEIRDVEIADDGRWRRKYLRSLRQRYARHPHFDALFPSLAEIVEGCGARLTELNESLIALLSARLEITTPVVRASELGAQGSRSELLAELCIRAEADVYLSGPSGRDYLDPAPFHAAGVEIRVHDYEHPAYPQRGTDGFVSHLSVIDLLFNRGEESADVLLQGSRTGPLRVPAEPTPAGAG